MSAIAVFNLWARFVAMQSATAMRQVDPQLSASSTDSAPDTGHSLGQVAVVRCWDGGSTWLLKAGSVNERQR
jgi:hypothetical protein